ncbi:hypothetical protein [Myxococcus sp. CA040A]|uniref:hypothetical protein n=1 Tax=Myxococcus sp. CA040A TaxID=2741738 RepID=UPI00157AFD00|nr:hypothetical protein [Myxococcus sp. CA040A]NTX07526.1 hypothetical protein [Myxococcus sp. CA040A]
MRWLLFAMSVAWLGCGGEDPSQITYDEWAERAATVQCSHEARCEGSSLDEAACMAQVLERYRQVEPELEDATGARTGCVRCMRIRTEVLTASLDSECQQPVDTSRINAACGADQQACAGAP